MTDDASYDNRGIAIGTKIFNLFHSLGPATYDEISPKIEYWIDYALTEQSMDADDLAKRLSILAWGGRSFETDTAIARFLKEFRDAPDRSEQARSCIDILCSHIIRWFAAASAEDLQPWNGSAVGKVGRWGGGGFVNAGSFVGHLIERGLLDHNLVRRHLVKPLIVHHDTNADDVGRSFRAMAIYKLFIAAKNTLLQGLLEPKDVEACFKTLNTKISPKVMQPDATQLKVQSSIYLGDTR